MSEQCGSRQMAMGDIIGHCQLCDDLQAEIERLRADNKNLQEELDRCRAFYEAWMTARRALAGEQEKAG